VPETKKYTVPISERALLARINRQLVKEDQKLVKTRSEKAKVEVGDYYLLNFERNAILRMRVDLEDLGHDLGVLKRYEVLDDGEGGER
jgi:hypothetical protein